MSENLSESHSFYFHRRINIHKKVTVWLYYLSIRTSRSFSSFSWRSAICSPININSCFRFTFIPSICSHLIKYTYIYNKINPQIPKLSVCYVLGKQSLSMRTVCEKQIHPAQIASLSQSQPKHPMMKHRIQGQFKMTCSLWTVGGNWIILWFL